jgi:hypothetical protein
MQTSASYESTLIFSSRRKLLQRAPLRQRSFHLLQSSVPFKRRQHRRSVEAATTFAQVLGLRNRWLLCVNKWSILSSPSSKRARHRRRICGLPLLGKHRRNRFMRSLRTSCDVFEFSSKSSLDLLPIRKPYASHPQLEGGESAGPRQRATGNATLSSCSFRCSASISARGIHHVPTEYLPAPRSERREEGEHSSNCACFEKGAWRISHHHLEGLWELFPSHSLWRTRTERYRDL